MCTKHNVHEIYNLYTSRLEYKSNWNFKVTLWSKIWNPYITHYKSCWAVCVGSYSKIVGIESPYVLEMKEQNLVCRANMLLLVSVLTTKRLSQPTTGSFLFWLGLRWLTNNNKKWSWAHKTGLMMDHSYSSVFDRSNEKKFLNIFHFTK